MDTFGLADLTVLLVVCGGIALVSVFGPALWRGFRAAIGPVNERRPMYHIVKGSESSYSSYVASQHAPQAVREQVEPTEPEVVRLDTHHHEPTEPAHNEPPRELPRLDRLSRREEIIMLATLRNEDGGYRHSANQITAFIGGTAAEVKDIIRDVRGEQQAKPAPVAGSIRRPAGGWNN